MNLLLSATSPDCSLAAIKAPSNASSSRHLIRIYQVGDSTATLQSTLTHTSKLPLVQLVFLDTSSVLGLFGHQEVVVWDLDRGVVATTLNASEDQKFLALASYSDNSANRDNKHYILVVNGRKLFIQEYLSSSNKLVRKIKSGRMKGYDDDVDDIDTKNIACLVITSSYFVVRMKNSGIRVMDKYTGKKTGKINLKESTSSVGEATTVEMSSCIGKSNIMVAMKSEGDAILYDLDSCKEIFRISTGSVTLQQANLQLAAQEAKLDQFTLIHNDSIYSLFTGKNKSPSYERLTQISTKNPVCLILKNRKVLALIHERSSDYRVQWIDFSKENGNKLPAVYKLDEERNVGSDDGIVRTRKRNASEIKVLGPGQAGNENIMSVKKLKANIDHGDGMEGSDQGENGDNEDTTKDLTIAERLQMLTDALEEEENEDENGNRDDGVTAAIAAAVGKTKFKPQKATTESLKELLTQALQSSDDALLELALSVHDTKIISTSIKEMDEDLLVILLGKLTSRLASSPLRAEFLSVWISNCLQRGSFDSNHLAVLKNMLYERIECFSDLLRLEGRLSMMVD